MTMSGLKKLKNLGLVYQTELETFIPI